MRNILCRGGDRTQPHFLGPDDGNEVDDGGDANYCDGDDGFAVNCNPKLLEEKEGTSYFYSKDV